MHRNTYAINKTNGDIFNLTFDIVKTKDGRFLLFATKGKIKKSWKRPSELFENQRFGAEFQLR